MMLKSQLTCAEYQAHKRRLVNKGGLFLRLWQACYPRPSHDARIAALIITEARVFYSVRAPPAK